MRILAADTYTGVQIVLYKVYRRIVQEGVEMQYYSVSLTGKIVPIDRATASAMVDEDVLESMENELELSYGLSVQHDGVLIIQDGE